MPLLKPKSVTIETTDGTPREYVLSRFPAVAGREIVAKYPLSAMPKLGDYEVNEATMLKLMAYVGVPRENGEPLTLTTRALIDNHVPDWETLAKIEIGMLEYNCSFFQNGKSFDFFAGIAQNFKAWILSILTDLSVASSQATKQPLTNSGPSTT